MTNHENPTGKNTEGRKETMVTETTSGTRTRTGTASRTEDQRPLASKLSHVAWGAVFAGALVALVVMAVLNILGLAVGAVALEAGAEGGFGIGAGIWWTVSALIALFIGGWTAGHFSDSIVRSDGLMHGVVTWALFVFASFLAVTTTIGQALGGAFGIIGQNISSALMALQTQEGIQATLIEQGLTTEQIAEAEATMAAAGEQAAEVLAIGAGWAFVALLLGVLISALGGSFGTVEPGEAGEPRSERFKSRLKPRTT